MNTIKFNDVEGMLLSFNKNTYFNEDGISGNITCEMENVDIDELQALGTSTITSMSIKYNDEVIYNVDTMSAKLTSINEYLMNNRIHMTLNINLSNPEN